MFKMDATAYELGRQAYYKAQEEYENPFGEDEENKEWSWSQGWQRASKENKEDDYDY